MELIFLAMVSIDLSALSFFVVWYLSYFVAVLLCIPFIYILIYLLFLTTYVI